jgi:hypothetical protein
MAIYGGSGAPAQSTFNYDSLVSTSLANYRGTLTDNISKSNPLFHELKKKDLWESRDGGMYIAEDLMMNTGGLEPYDGYDELPLVPNDGVTQMQVDWRQLATPIVISEKERKQNKHRIVSLLESRIKIAEIGMEENFTKHLLNGQLAGSGTDIREPYMNNANGALSIDPLPRWVMYDPTANYTIGNINQSTQRWWRNVTKTSAATTGQGFLNEVMGVYQQVSKGPGGPPDLIWTDMTTWGLWHQAMMEKYRATSSDNDFPYQNFKFWNSIVVWDEDIPDVSANGGAGALSADTTKGTAYFLNTKFFKIIYESETNFVDTEFQKPINQDVKGKHILWMGNTLSNNRRKQGVLGNISRTLTFSSI